MQDGEINFYSLSADGRVFNWVLMQNKLTMTTIITLFMDCPPVCGPDGTLIKLKGKKICVSSYNAIISYFSFWHLHGFSSW